MLRFMNVKWQGELSALTGCLLECTVRTTTAPIAMIHMMRNKRTNKSSPYLYGSP